jgi:hypothetical protein
MTLQTVICCVALSLTSCAQQAPAEKHAAKSRYSEPFEDLLPADSKLFSNDETKALRAAKARLEAGRGKTIDARYKVTRTSAGYDVFVMFVGGYDEHQKPLFKPGGHCSVALTKDFKIIHIFPGA